MNEMSNEDIKALKLLQHGNISSLDNSVTFYFRLLENSKGKPFKNLIFIYDVDIKNEKHTDFLLVCVEKIVKENKINPYSFKGFINTQSYQEEIKSDKKDNVLNLENFYDLKFAWKWDEKQLSKLFINSLTGVLSVSGGK